MQISGGITASTNPHSIGWMLGSMGGIEEEMSTRQILNGITTNSEIAESKNILSFSTKRF